jgi:hypothetical protein
MSEDACWEGESERIGKEESVEENFGFLGDLDNNPRYHSIDITQYCGVYLLYLLCHSFFSFFVFLFVSFQFDGTSFDIR